MRLTHSLFAVYDLLVQSMLGVAIALLIIGIGLWTEAASPALPGARPAADVYSIVSHFGYSLEKKNHLPLAFLDASAAADPTRQWFGALSPMSRDRFVIRPEGNIESPFDLVIGPLFRLLGVRLVGRDFSDAATRLPMGAEPTRELILSHASAVRWFGSAEAALGRSLTVATIEWKITGKNPAVFEIVGVAPPEFVGTNVEQRADFWIGINGWHGVAFPKQQVKDFQNWFAPASLMIQTDQPAVLAARIQSELRAFGEPQASIQLVSGTGYHPVRRARFLAIAQGLVLGLGALALMFVLSVAAHTFLAVERANQGDWVRRLLGESALRRGLRQAAAGLKSFAVIALAAGLVLAAAPVVFESSGLPITAALRRGLDHPGVIAGGMLALAIFLIKRPLLAFALTGWRGDRQLGILVAAFFGLSLVGLLLGWLVGFVGIARLEATLHLPLPDRTYAAAVVPLAGDGYLWMGSVVPTSAIEADAASQGWALATVGPDGGTVVSQRAQLRHAHGDLATVLSFNHVSANYFSVLGIGVELRCGALADWPADGALVNRQFLRSHGLGPSEPFSLMLENGQSLRLCGVVEDAQVLDARAGLAAMVYRPLRERKDLTVAVGHGAAPAQQLALAGIVREHFPDTRAGPVQTVRSRLDQQLDQERQMVRLNLFLMVLSGGVSAAAALMLGAASLRRQARTLGTRRALGSSRWELISTTLLGPSCWLRLTVACPAVLGIFLAMRVLGAAPSEWMPALGVATLGTAVWAAVIATLLLRQLDDQQLMGALKT